MARERRFPFIRPEMEALKGQLDLIHRVPRPLPRGGVENVPGAELAAKEVIGVVDILGGRIYGVNTMQKSTLQGEQLKIPKPPFYPCMKGAREGFPGKERLALFLIIHVATI